MSKEAMTLALEALRKSMQGNLVFDEAMEAFKALEEALAKQEQGEPVISKDAYDGAREDLAIWKKRALEAEELNRKFIAEINGPTFMGEPAQPKQEQGEPVAKMTAHRAAYFMERFKREEKLLGPNEKAAVDFVIAMLNTTPQPAQKPLTDEQIKEMWLQLNPQALVAFARAIEAAHGIKE